MIELLLEQGASGPVMAHWPVRWGCCWLAKDRSAACMLASTEIARYEAWLASRPGSKARKFTAFNSELVVLEDVLTPGGYMGRSGSAMALFQRDRRPATESEVQECFWTCAAMWEDLRASVGDLSREQRLRRSHKDRRSIEEILEHLGNCYWWYCSRIDDDLPEWPDAGLTFEKRASRFLEQARAYCLQRAQADGGASVTVPTHYPTADPGESWTLAKVLRRQAEHLWEHLGAMEENLRLLRGANDRNHSC